MVYATAGGVGVGLTEPFVTQGEENVGETMPETLDISDARTKFNTLDRQLAKSPVIYITRHGKRAFAIIDIEYLETVMETMEVLSDPDAMQMLQDSLKAIEDGDLIDQEDVERELLQDGT